MKKILFLLLCTVSMYGQVSTGQEQEFDTGIKNNSTQTVTEPVFVATQGLDGTYGKITLSNLQNKKAFLSTGLIKNGLISANGDPTKFNITAGIGIISNFDDPENPISTLINFPAFNSITPTYLTTGNITYVAINSTPAVVMQATPFTPEQRRDLIELGAVIHSNLTTINVLNNLSSPSNAVANQLHDLFDIIGALNLSGNVYTANGANLQLNKSAGMIGKRGVNFANNWKDPHRLSQVGETALTFRYRTQNGTESADMMSISPGLYDLNNVLTTVPNNKFTIQTVTVFQTGLTRIQWGQTIYDDLQSAKNALLTRNFVVESNIKENGITRAYIIVRNSTTSLQNVADAYISEAQKFGGVASGGVALTLANIVTALGYTPENEANKVSALTASAVLYPNNNAVIAGLSIEANARDLYNRGNAIKPITTKKYGLLVAGQSNTDGRVTQLNAPVWLNQSDPSLPNVNMFNRNTGLFDTFKLGVNTGADNNADTRWAYDMVTYYALQTYLSDDIYVIKRSKGGTPISTISATGGGFWESKFELITSPPKLLGDLENQYIAAKKADSNFEIRAFLWHQGESDADNPTSITNYYQNFKNVISYVRGFTGNPRLPIVFGTVSTLSAQYNSTIKAAQLQIANEDPFAYVVDMGAATLLDLYHFDATSSEFLGNSMYDIIKDFSDVNLSLTPELNNKIDKVFNQTNKIPKINANGDLSTSFLSDNGLVVSSSTDIVINGIRTGIGSGGASNTILAYNTNPLSSGTNNTFLGYETGRVNTTGTSNTFLGRRAGYSNTTGNSNTIIGLNAGLLLSTSSSNNIIGFQAGTAMLSGIDNVINGYQSGYFIGNSGVVQNTALDRSVLIGGATRTLNNGDTNEIAIGYGAVGLGSNSAVLGNISTLRSRIWGRFLSGKSSDDGINQGQFEGTVSAFPATLSNQVVVKSQLDLKSNIDSPTFTGVPSVPTASVGTNTTQIASTAFVANATANTIKTTGYQTINGGLSVGLGGSDFSSMEYSGFSVFSGGTKVARFEIDGTGSGFFTGTTATNISGRDGGFDMTASTPIYSPAPTQAGHLTNKTYVDKNTLKSYTVATLPASPMQGDSYAVTDALAPAYLVTVVGGGTVYTPVVWNGTNWVSH